MKQTTTLIEYATKKEHRKNNINKAGIVGFFLGPYGICFALFFIFPLVFGIIMSLCSFDGSSIYPSQFVGFDNFTKLFTNPILARDFWKSVWVTIRFDLIIVPLSILIPLGLALLISMKPPGYKFFRSCIYLPGIFPLTATGLILLKMFDYRNGFINAFFNVSIDWFGQTNTAWFMIGLFCLWCGMGGNFIILCAGLENVDKTLFEAASVDGCNKIDKFFHITLPAIKPQLFICLFTTFIGYMNLYGQLLILASNTPDQSEMKSAVFRIQDMLIGNSKGYGYAAAMGICLGLIIIVIAVVQLVVTKERKGGSKHEEKFMAWKKSR